jgi:hypothetical protein
MRQSTDPAPILEHSNESWAESSTIITSGTDDPVAASWYLTHSRIWRFISNPRIGPIGLGVVLFLIVVLMIVFSPSTESHFIYTDF